jgi:hypothetical protein
VDGSTAFWWELFYVFPFLGDTMGDAAVLFDVSGVAYCLEIPYGMLGKSSDLTYRHTMPPISYRGNEEDGFGERIKSRERIEWKSVTYELGEIRGWQAQASFLNQSGVSINLAPPSQDGYEDIRALSDAPSCTVSIEGDYIGRVNGRCHSINLVETPEIRREDVFYLPEFWSPRRIFVNAIIGVDGRKILISVPSSLFMPNSSSRCSAMRESKLGQ